MNATIEVLEGRVETLLAIIETLHENKSAPSKATVERARDIARGKKGCERR